jgi:hypothetical protein
VAIACAVVSGVFLNAAVSNADYRAAIFGVEYFSGVCGGGADNDHNIIVSGPEGGQEVGQSIPVDN